MLRTRVRSGTIPGKSKIGTFAGVVAGEPISSKEAPDLPLNFKVPLGLIETCNCRTDFAAVADAQLQKQPQISVTSALIPTPVTRQLPTESLLHLLSMPNCRTASEYRTSRVRARRDQS